jgi:hypothetical protein
MYTKLSAVAALVVAAVEMLIAAAPALAGLGR